MLQTWRKKQNTPSEGLEGLVNPVCVCLGKHVLPMLVDNAMVELGCVVL